MLEDECRLSDGDPVATAELEARDSLAVDLGALVDPRSAIKKDPCRRIPRADGRCSIVGNRDLASRPSSTATPPAIRTGRPLISNARAEREEARAPGTMPVSRTPQVGLRRLERAVPQDLTGRAISGGIGSSTWWSGFRDRIGTASGCGASTGGVERERQGGAPPPGQLLGAAFASCGPDEPRCDASADREILILFEQHAWR